MTSPQALAPADFQRHVRTDADRIIALLATCTLDAPVKTCPGWNVTDLVEHLGGVHGWVTRIVRTGVGPKQETPIRGEGEDLAAWYDTQVRDLLAALAETDPDRPTWTLAGEQGARFWSRRQAMETVVHRVDAELAAGVAASELTIDPHLAAAGVTEIHEVITPRAVARKLGQPDLTGPLLLWATDIDAGWLLQPSDGSPAYTALESGALLRQAQETAQAEVSGTAAALFLRLWKRTDGEELRITGDQEIAERYLSGQTAV